MPKGYNRIVSIEMINFMVYEHERIVFDDSNIINLKGYNSAGKSTVFRALAVCFNDAYKRKQTKFIRFGKDYFRIIVEFSDGVKILRDKYINGQSLYEMYKDGELVYTTKEGSALTRIDGVPDVIEKYLGLCVLDMGTESSCLNFQTRKGRLWLVETTGSENYYSLHEVLQLVSIARANALLNNDLNLLNGEMVQKENTLHELDIKLKDLKPVTDELIDSLEDKEKEALSTIEKLDVCADIANTIVSISELEDRELPELEEVDVSMYNDISEISNLLEKYTSLVELPSVDTIDISRLSDLSKIRGVLADISLMGTKSIIEQLNTVKYDRMVDLESINSDLQRLRDLLKENKELAEESKSIHKKLKMIADAAAGVGKKFVKCTNCGTYMEV